MVTEKHLLDQPTMLRCRRRRLVAMRQPMTHRLLAARPCCRKLLEAGRHEWRDRPGALGWAAAGAASMESGRLRVPPQRRSRVAWAALCRRPPCVKVAKWHRVQRLSFVLLGEESIFSQSGVRVRRDPRPLRVVPCDRYMCLCRGAYGRWRGRLCEILNVNMRDPAPHYSAFVV
jgi:hypothetical protein